MEQIIQYEKYSTEAIENSQQKNPKKLMMKWNLLEPLMWFSVTYVHPTLISGDYSGILSLGEGQ